MKATSIEARSQVKRERVRAAARQLFVQAGFSDTSMDEIAAAAGVSKPTLYRYYQDKEALFADVLRELSVRRVWWQEPPVPEGARLSSRAELAEALVSIADSVLSHLLDPTYLGLLRVLIAEIPRSPQLASLFRASVVEGGPRVLTPVLERARASGLVKTPHPEAAARLLVGPLLGYILADGLLVAPEDVRKPTRDELARRVDLLVDAIT